MPRRRMCSTKALRVGFCGAYAREHEIRLAGPERYSAGGEHAFETRARLQTSVTYCSM